MTPRKMSKATNGLHLPDFRVYGFRAFRELDLPRLGQVNLIVGMNNVGKTSALEALRIYAAAGAPDSILDLLLGRDEVTSRALRRHPDSIDAAVSRLFYQDNGSSEIRFELGPRSGKEQLRVSSGWVEWVREEAEDPQMEFSTIRVEELFGDARRALQIKVGSTAPRVFPYSRFTSSLRHANWQQLLPSIFVSAYGLTTVQIGENWDKIALTDSEDYVLNALRIVAPEIERLSLIGDVEGAGERRIVVRSSGKTGPVPLRSMGDGMNRLLSLSLSLVNSRGGLLLLDEVENGIHYSVQVSMWQMILDLASKLNVQVFATTHSWDCIQAFAAAANGSPHVEGMLHRLERKGAHVRAVELSEDDLAIIARQRIEVR